MNTITTRRPALRRAGSAAAEAVSAIGARLGRWAVRAALVALRYPGKAAQRAYLRKRIKWADEDELMHLWHAKQEPMKAKEAARLAQTLRCELALLETS